MNITREVILDLLPLYLANEASPASRALVEEYLEQDPELAERIRQGTIEATFPVADVGLRPEPELRSLRRTRRLLGLQRWLFGLGLGLTLVALSMEITTRDGRPVAIRLLLLDHPLSLGIPLLLGLTCWGAYFALRRRLRTSVH
jgi:hypothetical protein